jgi:hypothetical protein
MELAQSLAERMERIFTYNNSNDAGEKIAFWHNYKLNPRVSADRQHDILVALEEIMERHSV